MKLHEVTTAADRQLFINMTRSLYKNDPCWVQPWGQDIESVFDPMKNDQFVGGEAIRWILLDTTGQCIGRIAAFYNTESAAREEQPTGGSGFFECIDNQDAANILFDAARDWLATKGMEAMDGGVNFGDRMMWWGVLVECFEIPIYGMNYNPPYYERLFENYGFKNYFNQYSFDRQIYPHVPMEPSLYDKAQRLLANSEYEFRTCDMKNLPKMAEDFRTVYNSAWAKFDGVKQLSREHTLEMMRQMKPIIDPEIMYFAYHNGEPVGFFIMIPDINQIIKLLDGRFGLWQKLRFLYHLKFRKSINRISGLIFGVAAEYQGKGVEAGLIYSLEKYTLNREEIKKVQYKNLEMSWVGDFNPVMVRMCEQYVKAIRYKRHVTYRYLFDHEKPFKRCPRLGHK